MLQALWEKAMVALEQTENPISGLPQPQVTVLLTKTGECYVAVNDITGEICQQLQEGGCTVVTHLLTVWKDRQVDVPSHAFRRELVEMNPENLQTRIFLTGKEGTIEKLLGKTLPERKE